eukprot:2336110-Amphidinium_carterae.2
MAHQHPPRVKVSKGRARPPTCGASVSHDMPQRPQTDTSSLLMQAHNVSTSTVLAAASGKCLYASPNAKQTTANNNEI